MVFNWFKRKFSNQDESTEQEPLTEDVVADDTDNASTVEEGDTSDDSDDSSAEDYLAWAQAAFDNLNEGSDSSESTEEVTVQDETEHPIDVAPKTASDQSSAPSEIEESAAIADTTSTLEPEEIESPDTEEVVKAKIESEHEPELEVEPTAEPAPKSVSEPAQAPEIKPAPTLNTATRSTDMDEGFRWSAEVLAAQGRKVEEVSAEEITWLKKLRTGLGKTRRGLVNQLKSVVGKGPLSDDAIEEIETLLLQADVGIQATDIIVESLQSKLKEDSLPADEAIAYLKSLLRNMLDSPYENGYQENFAPSKQTLNIWLMAGVNGVGKTTTIGKLTNIATTSGYRCLIAAADTFRAAAVQQVKVWGERSQVDVICNPGQNTDPASVVFDAISAAKSREVELLLVDTAGRLQNKKNLMDELAKVRRIIEKKAPEAKVESLLVLDATLGQNGLRQAQVFAESAKLTGVVLTKLDGTAKGGVALGVVQQLGLPIRFIGAGEGIADLRPFSSYEFVEALLAG